MEQADPTILTASAIDALAAELWRKVSLQPRRRWLVGIAGIPGSGKSTLASQLHAAADQLQPGAAALVPMDGYHLPNSQLRQHGLADRKGAPDTFDAAAYIDLLKNCRDPQWTGQFPIYDRSIHEPVIREAPACSITRATQLVITEGNYLLLNLPPWRELACVLDETWLLATPEAQAKDWILSRHQSVGRTEAQAIERYASDLRNTQLIQREMRPPGRVLRWPSWRG